ncbi:hypothetical protein NPIL_538461, partial [Nephila pilipes]
ALEAGVSSVSSKNDSVYLFVSLTINKNMSSSKNWLKYSKGSPESPRHTLMPGFPVNGNLG